MPRTVPPVVLATALALLLSGCGGSAKSDDAAPGPSAVATASAATTPDATDPAEDKILARLLPTEKYMKDLLGLPVEVTTAKELTKFHEGAQVPADTGLVGQYHKPGEAPEKAAGSGALVALSIFRTVELAERFLVTNPNYDPKQEADPDMGVESVFDLKDVADFGHGYEFTENGAAPTHFTAGTVLIGRVVVEIALFHATGVDMKSQVRTLVTDLRKQAP